MKVGIITIHKIFNYGSALQAYALQCFVSQMVGDKCEIIDYVFPNSYHIKMRNYTLKQKMRRLVHGIKLCCKSNVRRSRKCFSFFWQNNLKLTEKKYHSPAEIKKAPPEYDFLIVGSDQVWNTESLCGDDVFLLSFDNKNTPKMSYASSFGKTFIDPKYALMFKKYLNKFRAIGVRENSGLEILSSIEVNQKNRVVCDPTLLLNVESYEPLARQSNLRVNENYILVYFLSYAFDPNPAILNVVNDVFSKLKYKVIFINNKVVGFNGPFEIIDYIGPNEFVYLFKNASFVVTSSFHGTAFSVINRKPFVSISPRGFDSRIKDFLTMIGLETQIVYCNEKFVNVDCEMTYSVKVEEKLNSYIENSKQYLRQELTGNIK